MRRYRVEITIYENGEPKYINTTIEAEVVDGKNGCYQKAIELYPSACCITIQEIEVK